MQDYKYDELEDGYDEAPDAELNLDQEFELAKKKNKKALILWSSVLGAVILAGIIFIAVTFSIFNARKNAPKDITADDYTQYLEYNKSALVPKNDQEDNNQTCGDV